MESDSPIESMPAVYGAPLIGIPGKGSGAVSEYKRMAVPQLKETRRLAPQRRTSQFRSSRTSIWTMRSLPRCCRIMSRTLHRRRRADRQLAARRR